MKNVLPIRSSTMRRFKIQPLAPALACVMLAGPVLTVAHAKEKQRVTVSYVLRPTQTLPDFLKAVAVIDAGVQNDEADRDQAAAREKKWAAIAAEMIEAMLQGAANGDPAATAIPAVVQRRATKKILEEQDLQLAGIVEGDPVTRVGKLLAVQGLIMSRISIHMEMRRNEKTSIDWMGLLGAAPVGGRPRHDPRFRHHSGGRDFDNPYGPRRVGLPRGPGIDLPTRTITEISRNLTVQCNFALVDATSGRSLVKHTPPVCQKTDTAKPDFLFGGCVDAGDLDPIDHFIGELVERAARDFVSQFVPTRVAYTYEVIGKGDFGEAAVRALRADDYSTALAQFEKAHEDDPKRDWHVFGMAVTCELMGDPARALQFYRQAASMPKVDDDDLPIYLAAKDRLTAHLDRIVPVSPATTPPRESPRDAPQRDESSGDDDDD
jgi:hypothetical protein